MTAEKVLAQIISQFPGLVNGEDVNGSDLVEALSSYRDALEEIAVRNRINTEAK